MKWTYDWLKEHLETSSSAQEIAAVLTRIGLEVEDLSEPVVPIAAKIVECEDIPDTHLHKLMVDDSTGKLRQVVCGAPNARVGLVSALALPGCKISGMEIKSGKIRGVLSDGMLCSAKELGISDDHSGIIELDKEIGSSIGSSPSSVVFDAGITPNRPDYLAVRGIARDLAAAGLGKLRAEGKSAPADAKGTRKAVIENLSACPTYRLCEIHGIKIAPSDAEIASRLGAIGINPKNAPIDATNYVCYDLGQPMHCFDADEIQGDIIVRNAKNGEKFTDLFGAEHELGDTDLVITDAAGILALAGIVGGLRGMTTANTQNIILESAYFEPVGIRKTSKRLGLQTDSSYRYERGIDPNITGAALSMAVQIITDACGGKIVGGVAAGRTDFVPDSIEYFPGLFLKKTGIDIPAEQQRKILENLGYKVGADWKVLVPSWRVDDNIPEKLIADIIRIYGYDKIEVSEKLQPRVKNELPDLALKVRLASLGFAEAITFGFTDSAKEKLIIDRAPILVANPVVDTMDAMRGSLLTNLLAAVSENEKRGEPNLEIFEIGTVFDGGQPGQQHTQLVLVRAGANSPKHWLRRNRLYDIFDTKADLLKIIGADAATETSEPPLWAHPFRYGSLVANGRKIAEFGELHPMVAKKFGIKTNVVIGLVENVADLPEKKYGVVNEFFDFQPVYRDFAFWVECGFPSEKIAQAAKSADDRITSCKIFDVFNGGENQKSVAFTLRIQPRENMDDSALQELQSKVISEVEKNCPAKIRDK